MVIDPDCVSMAKGNLISLSDSGRSVVTENKTDEKADVVRIDGCAIKQGPRADFLVRRGTSANLIVELKGKNAEHGAEQVEKTIVVCKEHNWVSGPLAALVVSRQVPAASSSIQRITARMRKKYGVKVWMRSHRPAFCLDELCN